MSGQKHRIELGEVQETLLIPLAARARHTRERRPVLRDPKAVEMVDSIDYDFSKYGKAAGGPMTILRTASLDQWIGEFLAEHPAGTVVEIGTGLNTRFDRLDNGSVHWLDLDLPDSIELRRKFFADTDRRRMLAASVLDSDWLDVVAQRPGPYFFVAEGVLPYLPAADVSGALTRIADRFPGALIAFDSYSSAMRDRRDRAVARRGLDVPPFRWTCDDPRSLSSLGLRVVELASVARPPEALRRRLPLDYRVMLRLVAPLLRGFGDLTLLRA